jgi:hypothetical protein
MYPNRFFLKALGVLLTIAIAAPVFAVDQSTAQAVVRTLEKAPVPSARATDFEKWSYDTLVFTARECWRAAHPSKTAGAPSVLETAPTRTGTYSAHSQAALENVCAALASTGFTPWCATAVVQGDRRNIDVTLMRDYLQMEHYDEKPRVTGGLYCYVSKSQAKTQFFAPDELKARWVSKPALQQFQMPEGTKTLNAGTIVVEVQTAQGMSGKPFSQPFTAVVP